MTPELFSRRYNLRNSGEKLIYDDVPVDVRNGFRYIFDDYIQKINTTDFINDYCEAMGKPHDMYVSIIGKDNWERVKFIESCLEKSVWWEFLDICEIFSLSFYKSYSGKRGEFSKRLNSLFKEKSFGYEMQEGKIERISDEFSEDQKKK